MFLVPVFFLPITSEFYEYNKQALLLLAAGVSLLFWTLSFITDKQVRLTRSPIGLPLLAIAGAWLISSFLRTPNRLDALLDPGQTGTLVSLIILFFTGVNSLTSRRHLETAVLTLMASFALFALITILWTTGIASSVSPAGFNSPLWSPAGNLFAAITILAVFSLFLGVLLIKGRREARNRTSVYIVTLVLCLAALSISTWRLFFQPDSANRPVFLSQSSSWASDVEAIKQSPLFGSGPATFLSDFTRFRPISYNLTENWAVRFASSSNYYLQVLATVGVLGLFAQLYLVLNVFKLFARSHKTASESPLHSLAVAASTAALVALVAQAVVPTSLVLTATIIFLLVVAVTAFKHLGSSLVHDANIDIVAADFAGSHSPILPWISLGLALVMIAPTYYFASRAYAAEILFHQALRHAAANDGRRTYETLISTIKANPYKDTYRVTYSQTNLLLANSLAAGKTELTDDQRTTITQLIQQAVREAKNAVLLNPAKVSNTENLAGIYRSLLTLAQGADAWTVASYRQAIQLDPVNPNLRIALGGVYYGAKNYDEAARLFAEAVNLKPNHANAHYNLAVALREKGDLPRAAAAMQNVVNLVQKDSADYTKALAELEELRTRAGQQSAEPVPPAETQLTQPEALPTPQITPIQLPEELGPDTTPSPTPEPTVSPTPTP